MISEHLKLDLRKKEISFNTPVLGIDYGYLRLQQQCLVRDIDLRSGEKLKHTEIQMKYI